MFELNYFYFDKAKNVDYFFGIEIFVSLLFFMDVVLSLSYICYLNFVG